MNGLNWVEVLGVQTYNTRDLISKRDQPPLQRRCEEECKFSRVDYMYVI